jgi:hypothetical protein
LHSILGSGRFTVVWFAPVQSRMRMAQSGPVLRAFLYDPRTVKITENLVAKQ